MFLHSGSQLLSGYRWGLALYLRLLKSAIGTINIGGSMRATSIAANVKCGPDHVFGINDLVLVPNLTAGIKTLTVKGEVGGDGSTNL